MESILVRKIPHAAVVTLSRKNQGNSINEALLSELNDVLDDYENDIECKAIILESNSNVFCAGMDFKGVFSGKSLPLHWIKQYKETLKRFTEIPKVMIAKVEGKVIAGGAGLVAACDLVYANEYASFSLPECLWGLLPANVLPYLIRRVGFQSAYFMTITTQVINATEAKGMRLIDVLCHEPDVEIQTCLEKLALIDQRTFSEMKTYFKKLWLINEKTEELAVNTLDQLIQTPLFQANAKNFLEHKKLPWEKGK